MKQDECIGTCNGLLTLFAVSVSSVDSSSLLSLACKSAFLSNSVFPRIPANWSSNIRIEKSCKVMYDIQHCDCITLNIQCIITIH